MQIKLKISLGFLLIFCFCANAQNTVLLCYKRGKKIQDEKPDSAAYYYKKILGLLNFNLHNDTVTFCYGRIGDIESDKSDFQNAFHNYLKMLSSAELTKNIAKQINGCNNLAIILNQQRKYPEALNYVNKSIKLARQSNNHFQVMNGLVNLSDMLVPLGKTDSSILVLKEAEKIARQYHFEPEIPNIYANLGNIYYTVGQNSKDKKFYNLSVKYAQEAITWLLSMKNPSLVKDDYRKDLAYAYGLKGAALAALGKITEAEEAYHKAIAFFLEQHDLFNLNYLYYELTNMYIQAGQNEKAAVYLNRYDSLSKLLFSNENSKTLSEMQTKYETEKKETENKTLQTENDLSAKTIKQQKIITYFIVGGLILAIAFGFFIFRGLKQQRKTNRIISKQKAEVERQKELVDEKQKEILDSIHYARRIQRSLLTSEKYINRILQKHLSKNG